MSAKRRTRDPEADAAATAGQVESPSGPGEPSGEHRPDNETVVVELALRVLASEGLDEPDDELIETLRRLYRTNPICQIEVRFTGDIMRDMLAGRPSEHLAPALKRSARKSGSAMKPSAGAARAASRSAYTRCTPLRSGSTA
jgi:hypothetical protein